MASHAEADLAGSATFLNARASVRRTRRTMFCEGTSGGVSVVRGPHFVPKAGRKKRQGVADPTGPAPDAGTEPSVQECSGTAASAQEYSEYNSSQCPDEFIDSDDEEDVLNETLSACQLG